MADDFAFDDLFIVAIVGLLGALFWRTYRQKIAGQEPFIAPTWLPPSPPRQILNAVVPMQVSTAGIGFLKAQEGLTLTVRMDAGHPQIGYGHDIPVVNGVRVDPILQSVCGTVYPKRITQAQAEQILSLDLGETADVLNENIDVAVTQNEFDALASLEFNIGEYAFVRSTVLKLLNQGDYSGARSHFADWIKSQGKVNQDLVARRAAEQRMFG